MRIRNILLGAFTLLLIACSDDLSNLGSSIRPDADDLLPKTALFEIKSSTFLADSIYLRTTYPLLGQIEDPFYKTAIQDDYASTFYAPDGFNLNVYNSEADTFVFKLGEKGGLLNNQIDSAILRIFYEQYYGDSLAPMVVTAYELTESLPKNFYSNMSFDSYYDSQSPIGKAAYTAIDMSVSESIKEDADYIPYSDIHLIHEIKERFFNAIINTPQVFDSKSAFQEFFKGVYFKNTFGNGTLVQVEHSTIGFFYTTVDTVMSSVGEIGRAHV